MMNFMRKYRQIIFVITLVVLVAGTFVMFGSVSLSGPATNSVAEVNGVSIPYRRYVTSYQQAIENLRSQSQEEIPPQALEQKKQEVLQDLIQEEVFWQEAKKYGITVTDQELAATIQSYPAFQREGKFDRNQYEQIVMKMLRSTLEEFEQSQRKRIAYQKLRMLIASSVQVSEPEVRGEYARAHNNKMANFEKDREKFTNEFRNQKTMMVMNEWFRQLNETLKDKIKVHLQEIEQGARG